MKVVHMANVYFTMCGRYFADVARTRDEKDVTCKQCLAAMAKTSAKQKDAKR